MEPPKDIGFRPKPDGFSVPNIGLAKLGLRTSWTTFEKAFDNLSGMHRLAARYLVFPLIYSGRFDGSTGHCHGMASVSMLVFLDLLETDWKTWEPGISTLYDISSFESTMSRFGIRERGPDIYQAAQLSAAEVDHFLATAKSPPKVWDAFLEIKGAFSKGEPIILSFVKKIEGDWKTYLGSPMHSVLAYRYEEIGGDEVKVFIYEPNRPGVERDVTLHPNTNRFFYQDKPGETVYSSENGYRTTTTPASVLTQPDIRKLATIKRGIEVVSAHADLTIMGINGHIAGKLGGLVV